MNNNAVSVPQNTYVHFVFVLPHQFIAHNPSHVWKKEWLASFNLETT
jgi:hypothetical protein